MKNNSVKSSSVQESAPQGTTTPADEYDSPWKEIAGRFFPDLVRFFHPQLHQRIDWAAGYEFLEQELREVLRDSETGPRRVDKIVKVQLFGGEDLYLVLHVEVQVTRESGFPQRMFVYYIRLYDLYPESVVSLAILGDEDPNWKPKSYKHKLPGTGVAFVFRTVKLWEYNNRWQELEQDPSPIALVVMAHLKTKATRNDARGRLSWKVELVRQLYARGYSREDAWELFRLIDWLLALPEDMEKNFRRTVEDMNTEAKMKYVTSIERLSREEGLEKGLEKGRKEGSLGVLLPQFEEKFGPLDDSLRQALEEASLEQVALWAKRLISASTLDEVFAT